MTRIALTGLLVSMTLGCASFPQGRLGPTSPPASLPTWKPTVAVVLSTEVIVNGKELDALPQAIELYEEQTKRAFQATGYFSKVSMGLEESDLRAETIVVNRGQVSQGLAFLTGLTFFLIPTKATDVLTMRTTFVDSAGRELGTFERTEGANTWLQLFLIVATPFNWPNSCREGDDSGPEHRGAQ